MLGAIAGDIIGSRFEGQSVPPVDYRLFDHWCRFTDDTVCSLAIADALLKQEPFDASLRSFVRRYPDAGYGGMFREWAFSDGAPAYGSWANGAPMRTAAIGWLASNEAEVLAKAAEQASVTHNHPEAVAAAQAVSLAIYLALQGAGPSDIQQRLADAFDYDLGVEQLIPSGFDLSARGTAQSSLAAVFASSDWEQAVRTAIARGGDTDTLAAITGAVAEPLYGLPPDVGEVARAYLPDDLLQVFLAFDSAVSGRGAVSLQGAEGGGAAGGGR
jgi:ADP-ribosylglycohydrolase